MRALVRGAVTLVFSDGLERGEPAGDDPCRRPPGAAQPSPGLGDAACRRSALPAADARHGRHPAASRRALPTAAACRRWSGCSQASTASSGRAARRGARDRYPDARRHGDGMIPIVDAHHHIWRQADLPWLQGPMRAAHLRPLRADPARLSDRGIPRRHRRHAASRSPSTCRRNWAKDARGRGGRLGAGRSPTSTAGRTPSSATPTCCRRRRRDAEAAGEVSR